jgi:Tfp pilus assembly protein PilP
MLKLKLSPIVIIRTIKEVSLFKAIVLITFFLISSFAHAKVDLNELFKDYTSITSPADLRDPFKAPKVKLKRKKKFVGNKIAKGVYSNIKQIGDVALSEIEIVGVLIGKVRRAVARVKGGPDTYVLKEGMEIGENDAELKAIVPGGVILVERITNIYGQEEYLETIIPISKEN